MALAFGAVLWLALAMAIAFFVGRRFSGRIDAVWTVATGFACLAAVGFGAETRARAIILSTFFLIWLARLAAYLWRRATSDDPRYAAFKQSLGANADVKFFFVLQGQGVASWPLVLSTYIAAAAPRPAPDIRDILAALVFAAALGGETISDLQMERFKADSANKGKICDRGLWSWSRHPNYFFEWLGWVGLPVMAIDPAHGWSWLALLAPLAMYGILVHGTGIPPLESSMRKSRGAAFDAYAGRVSAFWPMPPKRA